jgi:hypothetical protein
MASFTIPGQSNTKLTQRAALLTFFLDLKEVYHKRRVNLA